MGKQKPKPKISEDAMKILETMHERGVLIIAETIVVHKVMGDIISEDIYREIKTKDLVNSVSNESNAYIGEVINFRGCEVVEAEEKRVNKMMEDDQ